MNIKALAVIFLSTSITFFSCNGQKGKVSLQNQVDSVSYGIGVAIGNNLKKDGLDSVNLDVMLKAMRATIAKDSLLMDMQQAQMAIQQYLQEIKTKKGNEALAKEKAFFDENAKKPGVKTLPSGLQYIVVKEGTGPKPSATDTVVCHYHGTFIDGGVFDSSVERGEPATFPLTQVISGWVEALQLMGTGSKWKVFIPSKLAYGERSRPGIDPNTLLIFDLELISVKGK
jgi:FKBP-type peptidyl-prolyl cis-trans isomerase FklB